MSITTYIFFIEKKNINTFWLEKIKQPILCRTIIILLLYIFSICLTKSHPTILVHVHQHQSYHQDIFVLFVDILFGSIACKKAGPSCS